jgi:predicted nuclease with TOPRIM domain
MNVREKMDLKWDEITATKNERENLFSDFDKNKERIIELHYEVEIKQLEYLLLKREQLEDLRKTSVDPENVERVNKINETCIKQLQDRLSSYGFIERLQAEKLI